MSKSFDEIYPKVKEFIRERFLLTEEMCTSDNLLDLADISLRHILDMKKRGVDIGEISRACSGASSVISKKILLIKAMQDAFGFAMTPEEFARTETVRELAEFISKYEPVAFEDKYIEKPEEKSGFFDVYKIRKDFPALSEKVYGQSLIYFDNAATMQAPKAVLEAEYEAQALRGNVHRGIHALSNRSSELYEDSRRVCAGFINADPGKVIFTAGTTDGINMIAESLTDSFKGILTSQAEHHSNFIPWQQLCKREDKVLRICPIDENGGIDMDSFDKMLGEDISLVAVTQCSNVTGLVTPVKEIIKKAHSFGAKVLIDGAQSAAHMKIDVKDLDCDYFVMSAHKIGGPFGIGLLYAKELPVHTRFGGGIVDKVDDKDTTFLPVYEAGTPNISGAAGFAAVVKYRNALPKGWEDHEKKLLKRAEIFLSTIPGISIIGKGERAGCISFVSDKKEA
ncbi:MAG: aminotransferase class V-fold PLP-dependent enzyme, partial [Eubacterium sp.]|nr:aminotransferase class V-fold PLP-dependent enzyme [Eubacterium sp.]